MPTTRGDMRPNVAPGLRRRLSSAASSGAAPGKVSFAGLAIVATFFVAALREQKKEGNPRAEAKILRRKH